MKRIPLSPDALDIKAFLDLVHELRTAEVAASAGLRPHDDARKLRSLLDDWLSELGQPVTLPVVWPTDTEVANTQARLCADNDF